MNILYSKIFKYNQRKNSTLLWVTDVGVGVGASPKSNGRDSVALEQLGAMGVWSGPASRRQRDGVCGIPKLQMLPMAS